MTTTVNGHPLADRGVLAWERPPLSIIGGKCPRWKTVLAVLRVHAGQWAKVRAYGSRESAKNGLTLFFREAAAQGLLTETVIGLDQQDRVCLWARVVPEAS